VKKTLILILLYCTAFAQSKVDEINSMPGVFSRMGFGARGIGMGNAISSITSGNLVSYYNPALPVFQEGNLFQTSYSFLSLDRSLNFLNFTRKFEFGKVEADDGTTKPRSIAGISAGIINSGVSNIDGRDNQGRKFATLSTSENQFFVAVANRFSDRLAIGIAFKFYHYKLYENFTSSGLGFDVGAIYSYNESLTVALMISDLNTKYEWDSGAIYGSSGTTTKNRFPLLKKLGVSYRFKEQKIIAAIEIENSNAKTNYLRVGAEYNIYQDLFFRAGLDKLNLSNFENSVRPSIGFSYFYNVRSLRLGFDYAFVLEPYSSSDQHIIGVNINF